MRRRTPTVEITHQINRLRVGRGEEETDRFGHALGRITIVGRAFQEGSAHKRMVFLGLSFETWYRRIHSGRRERVDFRQDRLAT